jgi:hypothetical protein
MLGSYSTHRRDKKRIQNLDGKQEGKISSSHGGEYDVQSCILGCIAV